LAIVFSRSKDGEAKSESFHLGDLLSGSKRLRKFKDRVSRGEFADFSVIGANRAAEAFASLFCPGLGDRCVGHEMVTSNFAG
jgi:hypothetical protein